MRYCENCGSAVKENDAFCPNCGSALRPRETVDFASLISRAKAGDQEAVAALYEASSDKAYYTVKSMIRDDDAVFDILQDSYLKAFSNLDSFSGGEKFIPWIRTIAANTARDYLRKKRPTLFSELSAGEEDKLPAEELFEDDRAENLPENVLDQAETARLIREILEELPEDQRAAIGMYYYEELSVREIALAMGASENAVKSRLLYGRRKIEAKVRELEKKGTKLYSLAPVPFLLWLFRIQKTAAGRIPGAPAPLELMRAAADAAASSAAPSAGSAAAAGTAGSVSAGTVTAGISAVKIAAAVFAAAAVLAAGAFGISRLVRTNSPKAMPAPPVSSGASVPAPPQAPAASEKPAPEVSGDPDPFRDAFERYREVLGKADTYDFGPEAVPSGSYQYALEYLLPDDSAPTLLLCQKGADSIDHVRIFYYETETGAFYYPPNSLRMGAAQTGGFRGGLMMMGDGNGIAVVEISAMNGAAEISRAVRSHSNLEVIPVFSGSFEDEDPYRANARPIRWYELDDPSGFDNTDRPEITVIRETSEEPESSETPEQSGERPDAPSASAVSGTVGEITAGDWAQKEQADGRIVLTGTVNTYSYEAVIELQGSPDPNAAWADPSRTYRLIVFDAPVKIFAKNGDGMGSREGTAYALRVDRAQIPVGYDGTEITFSVSPETIWWPSDTSLPLGQPSTADVHISD